MDGNGEHEPSVDATLEYEQAGDRFRFEASSRRTGDGWTLWRDVYVYDRGDDAWYLDGVVRPVQLSTEEVAGEAVTVLDLVSEMSGELSLNAGEEALVQQVRALLATRLDAEE